MDSLSNLINLLSPNGTVDLHCRFRGNWESQHRQSAAGVIPYHIVLKGSAKVSVGKQTVILDQGDVLLLPHGSAHNIGTVSNGGSLYPISKRANGLITLIESEGDEEVSEILCGEFIIPSYGTLLLSQAPDFVCINTAERSDCVGLTTLIAMLVRESLSIQPGAQSIVRELTSTFFTFVLRALCDESLAVPGIIGLLADTRLAPAISATMEKPQQHWTLEQLAALCHQSRASFIRNFARVYHLTPLEWITQLRMIKAAKLLISKPYSIGMIAEECGYLSQAAFTRTFKHHYQVTPTKYRQQTRA